MTGQGFRVGCQTFTWEMLGSSWAGGPDDLVEAISAGGYDGLEITDVMIGQYADRPEAFAKRLNEAGLSLVAIAYGSDGGFSEREQAKADLEACRKWCEFAAHFPGAVASMGSATMMTDGSRDDKISVAADVYNRSAEIGKAVGVTVALHPSSHHNTLLFDSDDYERMFALLREDVGWVPDTGHILRGGQNLQDTLRKYKSRIRYVHLKDVTAEGEWAMLGRGVCNTNMVLEEVSSAPHFNEWVVVEEESEQAGQAPADAVLRNRKTLREMGLG